MTEDGYKLYVNNVYVKTDIYIKPITYYLSDYGIITESASTTCGISNLIFINKNGELKSIVFRDGMCPKSDIINIENGKLIIEATSNCGCNLETDSAGNTYNPNWYVNNERYISVSSKLIDSATVQLSFDELLNKYNITEDFSVEARYIYNLSDNDFGFTVEDMKNIKQLYDEYSNDYIFR